MPSFVPVKLFHPAQAGAPVLSGTVGSLIALLDACLVDGFNLLALDSISVTDGVATATRAGGITYQVDDVVLVNGCSIADLNGEWRVTEQSGTTFKFPCPSVANGAAATAGNAKIAPLGWQKLYSGVNKAVYKRTDPTAPAAVLRVDDSSARHARVRVYREMTDVDTGVGLVPLDAQVNGGLYWHKSDAASAAPRPWFVIGDALRMVAGIAWRATTANLDTHGGHAMNSFGAIASWRAADAYPDLICGSTNAAPTWVYENQSGFHNAPETGMTGAYFVRSYTQIGEAVPANQSPVFGMNYSGGDAANFPAYPNPISNSLELLPIYIREVDGTANTQDPIRGVCPGVFFVCHQKPATHFTKLPDHPSFPGRKLILVASPYVSSSAGRLAFDLTGPW